MNDLGAMRGIDGFVNEGALERRVSSFRGAEHPVWATEFVHKDGTILQFNGFMM